MTSRNRSRAIVLSTVAAALLLVSVAPSTAEAQRRYRRSTPVVVIGGFGYGNYWMYDSWYQWGPRGYPPYGYRYGFVQPVASLRIDGEPRQAQVFVDGYYAGLVDDFDGIFQRLRLEPGGRTITIYLEGYRTQEQRLYLRPGADQKILLSMEPLGPGEQSTAPAPPLEAGASDEPPGAESLLQPEPRLPEMAPAARVGTLALRVQPATAEVFVDDERWSGPAGQALMTIDLPEGRHRVEVRSPGMATYTEEVLISRGRTLTLNVSLR